MPSLNISVPHALGQIEASARLKNFLVQLRERNERPLDHLRETWTGNRLDFGFSTYGLAIEGSLSVEPARVDCQVKLPLAAMLFKGQVEKAVREQLSSLLA